jgi:hypothetical protein
MTKLSMRRIALVLTFITPLALVGCPGPDPQPGTGGGASTASSTSSSEATTSTVSSTSSGSNGTGGGATSATSSASTGEGGATAASSSASAGATSGTGGAGGCIGASNGTPCDDGDACTTVDTCQSSVCTGTIPVVCMASDQCHAVGVCDKSTGVCSNPSQADGTACKDGNACTQVDTCVAGACLGASPVMCAQLDQCHSPGTCDSATGACSNPNKADGSACNDGSACTPTDTCAAGVCVGNNPSITVPQLRTPMNNAYVGNVHAATTMRPKFSWEASTGAACGAITYDLQYSADPAFGNATTVAGIAGLTYQPPADLVVSSVAPVGTRYFWRVRACAGQVCTAYSGPPGIAPAGKPPVLPWHVNVGRDAHDVNGDGYADFLVGAQQGANGGSGKIFVFFGSANPNPNLNINQANATFSGSAANSSFGTYRCSGFADLNGDGFADVLGGGGGVGTGTAYAFLGSAGFPANLTTFTFVGEASGDAFGSVVSSAGDVNGDGFDELLISADTNDGGGSNSGRVYLYYGGQAFNSVADLALTGKAAGSYLTTGRAIGDVNGDGFGDIVTHESNFQTFYPGSASGIDPLVHTQLNGYGFPSKRPGDVNGDGFADFASGDTAAGATGSAYVFFGKAGPINLVSPTATLQHSTSASTYFGETVSIGDSNGDGFDDILVGANDALGNAVGTAFMYFGASGATFESNPDGTKSGGSGSFFAYDVSCSGDINGDGVGDVLVGEVGINNGQAHAYFGSNVGGLFPWINNILVSGAASGDQLGTSVSLLDAPRSRTSSPHSVGWDCGILAPWLTSPLCSGPRRPAQTAPAWIERALSSHQSG